MSNDTISAASSRSCNESVSMLTNGIRAGSTERRTAAKSPHGWATIGIGTPAKEV